MHRYHFATKRGGSELRAWSLADEPLSLDEARDMRGSGWDGDLDDMREGRFA